MNTAQKYEYLNFKIELWLIQCDISIWWLTECVVNRLVHPSCFVSYFQFNYHKQHLCVHTAEKWLKSFGIIRLNKHNNFATSLGEYISALRRT